MRQISELSGKTKYLIYYIKLQNYVTKIGEGTNANNSWRKKKK